MKVIFDDLQEYELARKSYDSGEPLTAHVRELYLSFADSPFRAGGEVDIIGSRVSPILSHDQPVLLPFYGLELDCRATSLGTRQPQLEQFLARYERSGEPFLIRVRLNPTWSLDVDHCGRVDYEFTALQCLEPRQEPVVIPDDPPPIGADW